MAEFQLGLAEVRLQPVPGSASDNVDGGSLEPARVEMTGVHGRTFGLGFRMPTTQGPGAPLPVLCRGAEGACCLPWRRS